VEQKAVAAEKFSRQGNTKKVDWMPPIMSTALKMNVESLWGLNYKSQNEVFRH